MAAPSQKTQLADNSGNLYSSTNKVPVTANLVDGSGANISSTNPLPVVNAASSNRFFTQGTTGSTGFTPAYAFGFASKSIIIRNDGTDDISFSFDGTNLHGILQSSESLPMDGKSETRVYFKSTTLGQTFRVFAW